MNFKQEISEKLNVLLQNSVDAVKGYKKASENAETNELKLFFSKRKQQRAKFIEDLRIEILRYGQIPEDETSFKSDVHRAWIDVKTFFSSNDDQILLEECIKGDEKALEDYEDLLKDKTLPPTLDKIFVEQHKEILSSLNKDKMYLSQITSN